jgi:hypothetical protein
MNDTPSNEESGEEVSPVWCMVGNIVEDRPYGPGGQERRGGTKHFRAGAKVYCFPALWGDGYRKIKVIGHHRMSNKLVTMVISSKWVINRRADLVYSPAIIRRFGGAWDGSVRSRMIAEELAGTDYARWARRGVYRITIATILGMIAGAVCGGIIGGVIGLILGCLLGGAIGFLAAFVFSAVRGMPGKTSR